MLHLLYILAFTVIAFFAIGNLLRSLIHFSTESGRRYSTPPNSGFRLSNNPSGFGRPYAKVTHPELLDESGRPINEPLLVMRSVNVDDAREQLDAIYNSSPGKAKEKDEEI